jgi:hypothetical protein
MLELVKIYLRLMRTHDFSYCYIDDVYEWRKENEKRIRILMFKGCLLLTSRGRWFIEKAEKRYGYV